MIQENSYFYTIEEVIINRKSDENKPNKEPHQYLRLVIKHRLQKSTLVVFTKSIRADAPNAFQELLELAGKMRATY
jgi:hypothetical protein